jgi:hypothetical protein
MPRLILLYFDDNKDAERFANLLARPTRIVVEVNDPLGDSSISQRNVQAIGSYMVPTKFCTCPGQTEGKARSTEGTTFGLRIHRACGLPHNFESSGQSPKNLIRPDWGRGHNLPYWIYFYPQKLLKEVGSAEQ